LRQEQDLKFNTRCAWCNTEFEYSYLRGGTTCKTCGKPTGKAEIRIGASRQELWQQDYVQIGEPEGELIPFACIVGWNFRCAVTTGVLIAFLKECAMLADYNPITVMSMDTARDRQTYKKPTWHWNAHVSIPIEKKPFELQGVEWFNESTVRAQSFSSPKIKFLAQKFLAEYDSIEKGFNDLSEGSR
jgi:hypothetical protein